MCLRSEFRVVVSAYERCSVCLYLQLFIGGLNVLFTLFVFVCVKWCPTHIVLCFCFVCLHVVYPILPVSPDCQFLIAPSVFSNAYL